METDPKFTETNDTFENSVSNLSIPGINPSAGIKYCGSPDLYIDLLRDVYGIIEKKCSETETFLANGDLKQFTTSVHSLKTTCRMIGHAGLAERFFELEKAGKEGSLEKAKTLAPDVFAGLRALKPLLEPCLSRKKEAKLPFSTIDVRSLLKEIEDAAANFDISRAETAMSKLLTFTCGEDLFRQLKKLSDLVNDLDYEEASELASSIRKSI